MLIGAAVINRSPLRWTSFVVDLTARQWAERERAELLARERAAQAEADSAGERLALLLRAGGLVAARDRHELLGEAARLVVDSMADFCIVYLPAADNSLRAASIAYLDQTRGVVLADLRDGYSVPVGLADRPGRLRHGHQPAGAGRGGSAGRPRRHPGAAG